MEECSVFAVLLSACTWFMLSSCLQKDAPRQKGVEQRFCTGVFDGHGFNGRSAAIYASRNMTRWLGVDGNAASKDPKRRLKALESVCAQIERGLARPELCGFDSSASGLATCCALLQGNRLCIATIGEAALKCCDVSIVMLHVSTY